MNASYAGDLPNVRTHFFVERLMGALGEKVQIEVRQHARKSVGIDGLAATAVVPTDTQAIAFRPKRTGDARRQDRFEDSLGFDARHRDYFAIE